MRSTLTFSKNLAVSLNSPRHWNRNRGIQYRNEATSPRSALPRGPCTSSTRLPHFIRDSRPTNQSVRHCTSRSTLYNGKERLDLLSRYFPKVYGAPSRLPFLTFRCTYLPLYYYDNQSPRRSFVWLRATFRDWSSPVVSVVPAFRSLRRPSQLQGSK
ncbi:hypothetical protein GALMADRAFT_772746 [Galerina marginata CBS 339.88]|uniref:Uncharacterized protein n=1 Tax=Galerina marginata (strain CBS 339.88) TaxID=685588 RepID=A0A067SPQ0_GALM3|nr:hypothetical protein GALMADRAFT_772746 [Galerina marginata CBS 339.88]